MVNLSSAFAVNPLIAILRGLKPENAGSVSGILIDAGFRVIEVPLNSPLPLESISKISSEYCENAVVGAGTVLTVDQVAAVADAGGKLIVSPNMNPDVGRAAIELGLHWCPGVMTPTEAFAALGIGASVLKFFPAEMIPPSAIVAMRAVLPKHADLAVVGGINSDNMKSYFDAGANWFGLGSALFKPDYSLDDISKRACEFARAVKEFE